MPKNWRGQLAEDSSVVVAAARAARRLRLSPHRRRRRHEEAREFRRGRRATTEAQFPQYEYAFAGGIDITTVPAGKAHLAEKRPALAVSSTVPRLHRE